MKLATILLIFSVNLFSQDTTVYIMIDEPITELPINFRKSNGGYKRDYDKMPDTTGLGSLMISGSAEFGAQNFPAIEKEIGYNHITVVDLRQETHFQVNGITISWYGQYDWADVGLSRSQVRALEKKRMDSVKSAGTLRVVRVLKKDRESGTFIEVKDTVLNVKTVYSEEEYVKSLNNGYCRITVTDRRMPTVEDVDRFIRFVNELPNLTWLHFHCHAGDGRTTTFMAMYDMIKNAKLVSYDNIILRQYLIGGIDLNDNDHYPAYEKPYAIERTAFLKQFYNYCRENTDRFKTNYSGWLKN